ncbi:MAG: Smr/MutS family protein [Erysipelotrichaceae bacterium]
MGTGALARGVQGFLKHHPKVESFHFGGQGEGGLGATVVVLKGKGKA